MRKVVKLLVVVVASLLVLAIVGAGGALYVLHRYGSELPDYRQLADYQPPTVTRIHAADGRLMAEYAHEKRIFVLIEATPKRLIQAFLAAEDKNFYAHPGIDPLSIVRAVLTNLRNLAEDRRPVGASTITQQVAKNFLLSNEVSLRRKVREAILAFRIERAFSKDQILELYLNQIYLGNGAYGVETAAQRYFGKSARDLNLAEAATLAALPKGPERYNPRKFPERAVQRRNTIIELMRREGSITDADANLAKAYPLQLGSRAASGDVAPYFVEWVRKTLDDRFGRQLYEQGLRVYTTLDLEMQLAAERSLERQIQAVEAGQHGRFTHQSYEAYVARAATGDNDAVPNSPYLQGAFVALDPRSGAVRALVGGRDFDDSKFNRATQALRQPGSTFKPIVYSAAVQRGYSPAHITDDSPISVPQASGVAWEPQNYDRTFWGGVPLRRALYMSRNLSAINTGRELGEQTIIDQARRFGITSPIPPYPSIHIGSADVIPLEMIASYSVFATLGTRVTPIAIDSVTNARGQLLWRPAPERVPVLSPDEAWLMVDMMKDVVRRGTAYRTTWGAGLRVPSAGKTGTTNDGTDVWFIGYTSDLVAGVWMGFDKPRRIKANAQGGILAAPAWTEFMIDVYRRRPAPADWPRPPGVIAVDVDSASALLYGPACAGSAAVSEYFIIGTEPVEQCGGIYGTESPFEMPADSAVPPMGPPGPPPPPPAPRDTMNPFRIPPR
ncbi:MAG TPA: PBP1A family penicillin-binding protein [Gemmatimonadaceae bacterium]|nr:PBP1A family penicillin-binding protein [Gemmatimonadaceae bacterium]